MKFSLSLAALALMAPICQSSEEVSVEIVQETSNEISPTDDVVTISFTSSEVTTRFLRDASGRILMPPTEVDPDKVERTITKLRFNPNDLYCDGKEGEGKKVCDSGHKTFWEKDNPNKVGFSPVTDKDVCAIELIVQSSNCGEINQVAFTYNDYKLGVIGSVVSKCACDDCQDAASGQFIEYAPARDIVQRGLDPLLNEANRLIRNGEQHVLKFNILGDGETYMLVDRIKVDLISGCYPETYGDPHFKSWSGEHFEYHGQCDLVLTKVPDFADGLGLDVHLRTKIVRYWSYNKNAVIRIGADILEVTGSADEDDWEPKYWMNYEFQGELTTIGGFPVKTEAPASAYKRTYEIDLNSKYRGQKIIISTYKEFVRVDFIRPNKKSFGNAVGLLGNFETGKTLARDGVTEMNDFMKYGSEWQVMPNEPKLFHEFSSPQWPQKCIEPEDPRGERRRRLDESNISFKDAEAACAAIADPIERKDCVYDVIATQDLDMVGAF